MTKLLDYLHLEQSCPDGSPTNEYPTRAEGVGYFEKRFVYLHEEGVILDKLTGHEMTQTRFAKECFPHWQYRYKYNDEWKYGSIAKAYIESPHRPYLTKKVYVPGKHQEGVPGCWNTWSGWPYEPKEGDTSLWMALLDHVFEGLPDWEREWFEHWIAFQIQNPGQKVFSAVLMSGASGIGKGTILRVLEALFGSNAHGINEHELGSRFTSSVIDKQLVIADEIGVKGVDKKQVARRLKGWITEPKMAVERKHHDVTEIDNRVNFIFATNDPNPLDQEDDDRRYFDLRFPQKTKIDTTGTGLAPDFYNWFGHPNSDLTESQVEARRALMHYFLTMDLSRLKSEDSPIERFEPYNSVPETVSKAGFIELSSSDVVNWLRTLRDSPDDVLSWRGCRLNATILSTEDIWSLYQYSTADQDTKKRQFDQEIIRCGFLRKAHESRVRTHSVGLRTLWVIRPERFDEIFENEPPVHAGIRGLYDSEHAEIADFLEHLTKQPHHSPA